MKNQSFKITLLLLIILIIALYFIINQTEPSIYKEYYQGTITKIIDGDTLEVDNITIRLALVDSPEYYQEGSKEAKEFTSNICPIGSTAMIDVDKGQITDKYNRIIAVVYCNNRNLNAELIINGHATIDEEFCNVSEFKNEDWAREGC
jgi:endonuclease YncB( thermonuclease family)